MPSFPNWDSERRLGGASFLFKFKRVNEAALTRRFVNTVGILSL
ncbi:hypothetical protein [Funiculus sociatus]